MYHTSHSTKEGSTFQGHVAIVQNAKEIPATIAHLLEDQAMTKAACNSYAYRLKKGNTIKEEVNDDGEHRAAHRILKLFRDRNVTNVVVFVTRRTAGKHSKLTPSALS